ncbi:MAG TPA: VOC family protein [Acidimicrobiia bacterium]|nr:VOC family protein [Acidimicrobiia bacterium]
MVQNPPENFPRLTPYLTYKDAGAALDFLTSAFGFDEQLRMPGPDGAVSHAELRYHDSVVMLGSPGPDAKSPKDLGGATVGIYLYVDDVDKHFEVAKQAGATIIEEPTDKFYGDRSYTAEDPEGHQWHFAQHTVDLSEEEMAAAVDAMTKGEGP